MNAPQPESAPAPVAGDGSLDLETARRVAIALAGRMRRPVPADLPINACNGRILASDAVAGGALPGFDTAMVDGYAIGRAEMSSRGPHRVRVTRRILSGDRGKLSGLYVKGTAVRIVAGAAVPAAHDAILSLDSVIDRDGWIEFGTIPPPFENIRRKGAVARSGEVLLPAGRTLGPRDLALLAAAGFGHVPVRRKLRVAILSTGAELVEAGDGTGPGQIVDANRPMLMAELARPWIALRDLGIVGDDPSMLAGVLDVASEQDGVVVMTGGTGRGDGDHLRAAIDGLGGKVAVPGIAMTPGGTMLVAALGKAVVIGLPGDPVAAFTGMQMVGWPILRSAARLAREEDGARPGVATFGYRPEMSGCAFPLVRISGEAPDGRALLSMPPHQDAAGLCRLAHFDGVARLDGRGGEIVPGTAIDWIPMG